VLLGRTQTSTATCRTRLRPPTMAPRTPRLAACERADCRSGALHVRKRLAAAATVQAQACGRAEVLLFDCMRWVERSAVVGGVGTHRAALQGVHSGEGYCAGLKRHSSWGGAGGWPGRKPVIILGSKGGGGWGHGAPCSVGCTVLAFHCVLFVSVDSAELFSHAGGEGAESACVTRALPTQLPGACMHDFPANRTARCQASVRLSFRLR
jgi:hypothetical protein